MRERERLPAAQMENILSLLAHDDENGKLAAQLVDPNLFEGDYRTIAQRLVDYWRRYKTAPKVHTPDLFSDILEDRKQNKAVTYSRILDAMSDLYDEGINAEYVVREVRVFTRLQTMKSEILHAAEIINKPSETSVEQAEEILSGLMRARQSQFEPSVQLADIDKLVTRIEASDEFRIGIKELDDRHVAPARGNVILFLAPKGTGKSWFLITVCREALLLKKRVLYISFEMPEEDIQQRMYQAVFGITKRNIEVEIARFRKEKGTNAVLGLIYESTVPDFSFDSDVLKSELEAHIRTLGWKTFERMEIKRFAPNTVTAAQVEGYLDFLEATQSFIPDLIVFDNVGNLRVAGTTARDHTLGLGRQWKDIVGLLVDRNIAGVATHQVNRTGAKATIVKPTDIADAWSLVHDAHSVITLYATETERALKLARMYVWNARSEIDHFGVLLTQSYDTGQFALDSAPWNISLVDVIKDMAVKRNLIRPEKGDPDYYDDDDEDVDAA